MCASSEGAQTCSCKTYLQSCSEIVENSTHYYKKQKQKVTKITLLQFVGSILGDAVSVLCVLMR